MQQKLTYSILTYTESGHTHIDKQNGREYQAVRDIIIMAGSEGPIVNSQ